MPKLKQWVVRIGLAALIAGLSAGSTLVYMALRTKPRPALTTGLHGKWADVNAEFNRRVLQRFPLGSSEQAMTMELRREGFVRQDWTYRLPEGGEAHAFRDEGTFVCAQGALVSWRSNGDGQIVSIRGEYKELGCL